MTESEYSSFDQLTEAVTLQLYELTANLKTVQRYISKIPEKVSSGTTNVEHEFQELSKEVTESFKKGGDLIKKLQEWDLQDVNSTQKFSQESLAKEYSGMLQQYRNLQRQAAEKERALMQRAQSNIAAQESFHGDQATENTPLMAQQQQQQQLTLEVVDQEEVDFMSNIVQDREAEILDIERNINEVNAIFRDVGTLVNEQGALMDSVEENISNMATNTRNASRQLDQADAYQRKRRKWSCMVLMMLVIVVFIVFLVLEA